MPRLRAWAPTSARRRSTETMVCRSRSPLDRMQSRRSSARGERPPAMRRPPAGIPARDQFAPARRGRPSPLAAGRSAAGHERRDRPRFALNRESAAFRRTGHFATRRGRCPVSRARRQPVLDLRGYSPARVMPMQARVPADGVALLRLVPSRRAPERYSGARISGNASARSATPCRPRSLGRRPDRRPASGDEHVSRRAWTPGPAFVLTRVWRTDPA
jgi:hypothetical protein